jgi:hypothetical protein
MSDLQLRTVVAPGSPGSAAAHPLRLPGDGTPDPFLQQAGPDARVSTPAGPVAMVAIFSVDPKTNRVTIAVFDDRGLVRMIPPEGVFEMFTMMNSYHP